MDFNESSSWQKSPERGLPLSKVICYLTRKIFIILNGNSDRTWSETHYPLSIH